MSQHMCHWPQCEQLLVMRYKQHVWTLRHMTFYNFFHLPYDNNSIWSSRKCWCDSSRKILTLAVLVETYYGITSLKPLDWVGMFETWYTEKSLYAAWSFKVHFQTATANVTQMVFIEKALKKRQFEYNRIKWWENDPLVLAGII